MQRSRQKILEAIHESDGLAAVQISKLTRLNPASVKHHLERLISDGKIQRAERVRSGPGRPMNILKPNPSSGYAVGVDMDLSQVFAVVTDMGRNVIRSTDAPIRHDASGSEIVDLLVEITRRVIRESGIPKRKIHGLGYAVSGFYDREAGVAVMSKSLPGWRDVPVRYRLSESFDYPVLVDNSVMATTMAEKWFGKGLGVKNFLALHVRTGVGLGMVVHGEPYVGMGNAGTINDLFALPLHTAVAADQPATLLELASGQAIVAHVRSAASADASPVLWRAVEGRAEAIDAWAIVDAARRGDSLCVEVVRDAARCWGRMFARFIELFHPEKAIFTGTFAELSDLVQQPLAEAMRETIYPALRDKVSVELCELGRLAGALGAAAMVLRHAVRS